MKIREEIKRIYEHFGFANQIMKAREECKEAEESMRNYHFGVVLNVDPLEQAADREHMIEEMADAWIMFQQMIYALSAEDDFDEKVEEKIQRTLVRMKEGFYAGQLRS